jgi:putative nucleotidyltransferase with HDIG domain
VHPLFASSNLRDLWQHSLDVGRACERMATASGDTHPEEAFLAGLVHDIGRLAIWRLSGDAARSYARLLERGCEPVLAELFLFGYDHGQTGAEILRLWSFPSHLVDAVEHHHRPECSSAPLAALLFMAEARIAPSEAPESVQRLQWVGGRIYPEAALDSDDRESGLLRSVVAIA